MRILITGAAGNLGRRLVDSFDQQHELVLVDRKPMPGFKINIVDLSENFTEWCSLFEGVDAVIHLAGNPAPRAEWKDLVRPNIDALLNVYRASAKHRVSRVIFGSSTQVLAGYRNTRPVPVLNKHTHPLPVTAYGATKLFGERVAKEYSESEGVTSICIRIGWIPSFEIDSTIWTDKWMRDIWLSGRDFICLINQCISVHLLPGWSVINGVSANFGSPWDIEEAGKMVGYWPQDDAYTHEWAKLAGT